MFNTEAIICSENGVWTARACCPTVQKAESVRAGFIGPVRQINMFADLGMSLYAGSYRKEEALMN